MNNGASRSGERRTGYLSERMVKRGDAPRMWALTTLNALGTSKIIVAAVRTSESIPRFSAAKVAFSAGADETIREGKLAHRLGSLIRLVASFTNGRALSFQQELAKYHSGLMQLRLRISDRASPDARNFVVFITKDVVQYEDRPVPCRKLIDGALQIHSIDESR